MYYRDRLQEMWDRLTPKNQQRMIEWRAGRPMKNRQLINGLGCWGMILTALCGLASIISYLLQGASLLSFAFMVLCGAGLLIILICRQMIKAYAVWYQAEELAEGQEMQRLLREQA